jgi:hypothetical protein
MNTGKPSSAIAAKLMRQWPLVSAFQAFIASPLKVVFGVEPFRFLEQALGFRAADLND